MGRQAQQVQHNTAAVAAALFLRGLLRPTPTEVLAENPTLVQPRQTNRAVGLAAGQGVAALVVIRFMAAAVDRIERVEYRFMAAAVAAALTAQTAIWAARVFMGALAEMGETLHQAVMVWHRVAVAAAQELEPRQEPALAANFVFGEYFNMTRYAIVEDGTVVNIAEAPHPLAANWIQDDGTAKIGGTWDGQHFHDPVPPAPTIAEYTSAVQMHLDNKARERNYDDILSACTYAASSVQRFAAEGQACVTWRDAVWATCYTILGEVTTGARQPPTVEELLVELPVMVWPEV